MQEESSEEVFRGEPFLNFEDPPVQAAMKEAMAAIERSRGDVCPIVIAGEAYFPPGSIEICDPSDSRISLGRASIATKWHVDKAIQTAEECHRLWQPKPKELRDLLEKAAKNLQRDRLSIMASLVREAGKSWHEYGDVQELIDFCRFYALKVGLFHRLVFHDTAFLGEQNFSYSYGGPILAIPPFNFASLTGEKIAAALAVGFPVILKPPEQTPFTAYRVFQYFLEAGYPPEALAFLPGRGDIGEMLVKDHRIKHVSFTGRTAVGQAIEKLMLETGRTCDIGFDGVNSAIICATGLNHEAVDALIYSAFGYAGQKCSRPQFFIYVGKVAKKMREYLWESIESLPWGPPQDGYRYGPVIDQKAQERLMRLIERHKSRLQFPVKPINSPGHFVPTAVIRCDRDLWKDPQTHKEFFGPVICEIETATIEEAVALANQAPHQTTASLWSHDNEEIAYAVGYFMGEGGKIWTPGKLTARNIYLNRSQAGAMAERQPFGETGTLMRLAKLMPSQNQVVSKNLMLGGVRQVR